MASWPRALQTALSIALGSRQPMFIAWGPELTFLYNDAYAEILGDKHPSALGRPFQQVWWDIWDDIKPLVDRALAGEATIHVGLETFHHQHGSELRPGRYLQLCVHDTGVGMDEATRVKATEPFFSTKGIGRGTGLGLSMVHGLAAQLGGALSLESALGEGTTVKIWLPLSGADPTALASASESIGLSGLACSRPSGVVA